jgi:hypothetical protein
VIGCSEPDRFCSQARDAKKKNGWELQSDLQAAKKGVSLANIDIDEAESGSGLSREGRSAQLSPSR